MRYRDLGERADRIVSAGLFFVLFNVAWAVLLWISANASNLFISVLTADLVLLAAATTRAAWKAQHAKLDALIRATPGACDALIGAEERDEAEIEELRR